MAIATLVLTPFPGRQPLAGHARAVTIIAELALGVLVLIGDGFVYADARPQSLPWSWPAAGVMSAGIVWGTRAGLIAALITSSASLFAEVALLGRDSGVRLWPRRGRDRRCAAPRKAGRGILTARCGINLVSTSNRPTQRG